ncbi:MAG: helix-turn-helix transcriptional regulator [Eubacteriales bacterium]|nr:helix-turn-helix transcriptional regulator [Eubacteriales bacterium]
MAKKLGTSVPYLSAVENGKKNVPKEWNEKIASIYGLTKEEKEKLKDAIEESKTQYKIPIGDAGLAKRRAVLKFARSFDDMDDETAEKIIELLNNKGGEE